MGEKTCFVAMPICREGSDEYVHFRTIYDQFIKPVITNLGYIIVRSDELQKTGAITKDIVLALANADLVLVDLTDLNPNVFYELGVRHALRAKGTIMIVDETRTNNIPFDLSAYRVIQFRGELTGIGKLIKQLELFVRELSIDEEVHRDNPVHDWIPSLPLNAVASSEGSIEGELRVKLAEAHQRIARYEQAYGKETSTFDVLGTTPLGIVLSVLSDADEGNLPDDLIRSAEAAYGDRSVKEFLLVVRRIIEHGSRLSDRDFGVLGTYANNLGLPQVVGAIYEYALQIHPKSKDLRHRQLSHFAHSEEPLLRDRARQELLKEMGISIDEAGVDSSRFDRSKTQFFGVMLDSYHADELHDQALLITQSVVDLFPGSAKVLRNHGRALKRVGRTDEGLAFYQKALQCSDADDQTAAWFGNELHNRKRFVDAAEVHLKASLLDPEDAVNFANLADALSLALQREVSDSTGQDRRPLPESITPSLVEQVLTAAISCRAVDNNDLELCRRVAARLDIDPENFSLARMSLHQRYAFASNLYKEFESAITRSTPVPDADFSSSALQ